MRDVFHQKLLEWIAWHGIMCEHLVFERSTHSVAEAAATAGVTAQDFIKSICWLTVEQRVVVSIVRGDDRVNRSAVQALAAALARLDEVRAARQPILRYDAAAFAKVREG